MAEQPLDMSPEPLQQALASWPQWSVPLTEPPRVVKPLNSGLSHNTYQLISGTQQFALRIESAESRALAMSKSQEIALMRSAGSLAPQIVWSDETTLVTVFIQGSTWRPLENLKALCQSLHQLHQIQTDSDVANFDLLQHCDHYWKNIHSALSPNALCHDLFQRCRQHLTDTLKRHPEQCLCHNDLNPDNILRQKNDFVFLDWEYACNNSPYFELATLVEFYALSEDEAAQLSSTYWKDSNEEQHLSALQAFRIVVRFIEWLWLALKESDLLIPCENRLTLLLQRYGA